MELASNCVWALVSLALLAFTWRAGRQEHLRVSRRSAFLLVTALCLFLLPLISVSDDLLEARQAALPVAAQTWHLAIEGAASALEIVPILFAFIRLVACLALLVVLKPARKTRRSAYAAWSTRALCLRPPPALTA